MLRIVTTDTFYTITQPGYLTAQAANIAAIQNCSANGFEWKADDVCLISYANGEGFFNVDFLVNFTFTPMQSSQVQPNYLRVPVKLADFLANWTTPVPIVPGVPNSILFVDNWAFEWIYGSAALATGGNIYLQYNATTHGGGIAASNAMTASDFYVTANSIEYSAGGKCPIEPLTAVTDVGLYLSNASADFTVGTGGSGIVHVWFTTIQSP
jgi:hypothetical protein